MNKQVLRILEMHVCMHKHTHARACTHTYTYIYGIFILKIISKYKPVYSQSTNPCKVILLEYIPTF